MNYHLCIIYDGIANSVFESQLLAPFAQHVATQADNRGLLISFERTLPDKNYLEIVAAYPQIKLIMLKKIPFLGTISLRYAAYQLNKALKGYTIASVRARGPLAGWIAGHAPLLNTIGTVVQARGLAGQEYAYTHKQDIPRYDYFVITRDERPRNSIPLVVSDFLRVAKKIVSNHIHALRTWQYENVERWCYGTYARKNNVTIHAVSDALRDYIVEQFNAPADKITVESYDVPAVIDPAQRAQWRAEIRTQLGISAQAYVYVYSGSAKAWQCSEQTVAYFAQEYVRNTKNFLLILSQDTALFQQLCVQYNLPESSYRITTVGYTDIYRYLAAADAGIILRESHPINWVSRPTKALEYYAVGLQIVHNDTIAMLQKK